MADTIRQELDIVLIVRNDGTTNWESTNYKLEVGEIGMEYLANGKVKLKAGAKDEEGNLKAWTDLSYIGADEAQVYQSEVLPEGDTQADESVIAGLVNGAEVHEGDCAIIKRAIGNSGKVSYTSYVYNGQAWAAMDGNYNAANVYYDKNIQVTKSVGNITTSDNAPVDLEFKGKNMEQIWQYLYATEDLSLTVTQPKYTLSSSKTSYSGELGTTFSDPTITLTFSDGEYEYGSKDANNSVYTKAAGAGVVWDAATVTATGLTGNLIATTGGNTQKTATYSIPDKVDKSATDTTKVNRFSTAKRIYTVSSTASCPASARKPVTNLGNFIGSDGKITTEYSKGTKQTAAINTTDDAGKKSVTITVNAGWRGWFQGYKVAGEELDIGNLTSVNIRGLCAARNGSLSGFTVPKNTQQVFFACPQGTVKYKLQSNGVNIDNDTAADNEKFVVMQNNPASPYTIKRTEVSVTDANGENATMYDVFYAENIGTIAEQTLSLTYTKK